MDYHATTPVDPRVLEAMLPYFTEKFGNAASRSHVFGWTSEEAVSVARERVAKLINAQNPKEIVFTSGATESNNLAIKGVAEFYREKGNHIITTVIEHKAVLDTCKRLEKDGYRVTYLPVQKDGRISLDELRAAISDQTILISIMTANNEIGVLQPDHAVRLSEVLLGVGIMLAVPATSAVMMESIPREQASVGSAVMQAFRQVGALLFVGVLSAVAAAKAQSAFTLPGNGKETDSLLPDVLGAQISQVKAKAGEVAAEAAANAWVDGFKLAMLLVAAMALLGALLCLLTAARRARLRP
jgi:cysteine desulfurase